MRKLAFKIAAGAPSNVIAAVEVVAKTGVNLLDAAAVAKAVRNAGHSAEAAWIEQHTAEYTNGALWGFKPEEHA